MGRRGGCSSLSDSQGREFALGLRWPPAAARGRKCSSGPPGGGSEGGTDPGGTLEPAHAPRPAVSTQPLATPSGQGSGAPGPSLCHCAHV